MNLFKILEKITNKNESLNLFELPIDSYFKNPEFNFLNIFIVSDNPNLIF